MLGIQSSRRWPALVLAGVAIAISLWIWLLPMPIILRTGFIYDDAFYYFKVAQNVLAGHGFSLDGVNLSNGFHPLWEFCLIPLFAVTGLLRLGPDAAARVVLTLQAGLNLLSAGLLYGLCQSERLGRRVALLVALCWLLSPITWNITVSGLEGGLNAALMLGSVHLLALVVSEPARHAGLRPWLGFALAATVLARLDSVVFALATLWLVWRASPGSLRHQLVFIGPVALALAIPLATYVIWNQLTFGTLLPVSGQVKAWWAQQALRGLTALPLRSWARAVLDDLNFPSELSTLLFQRVSPILLALATRLARRALATWPFDLAVLGGFVGLVLVERRRLMDVARRPAVAALLLGGVATFVFYKVVYFQQWAPWYFANGALLSALLIGFLLDSYAVRLARWLSRWRVNADVLCALAVLGLAANVAAVMVVRIGRGRTITQPGYQLAVYAWMRAHLPPTARVASWNAGRLAYFSDYQVTNLDGLINSEDFFQSYLKPGRVLDFVVQQNISYIVDYVDVPPTETRTDLLLPMTGRWRDVFRPVAHLDLAILDDGSVERYEIWQNVESSPRP